MAQPLFRWEPRYELGVAEMDKEHRGLLEMMQTMHDAFLAKAPPSAQLALFKRLMSLAGDHFADEERYMESVKFPGLASHRIIHKNLVEKLTEFGTNFATTQSFPPSLFDFLKNWLASHIVGIDSKYAGRDPH